MVQRAHGEIIINKYSGSKVTLQSSKWQTSNGDTCLNDQMIFFDENQKLEEKLFS